MKTNTKNCLSPPYPTDLRRFFFKSIIFDEVCVCWLSLSLYIRGARSPLERKIQTRSIFLGYTSTMRVFTDSRVQRGQKAHTRLGHACTLSAKRDSALRGSITRAHPRAQQNGTRRIGAALVLQDWMLSRPTSPGNICTPRARNKELVEKSSAPQKNKDVSPHQVLCVFHTKNKKLFAAAAFVLLCVSRQRIAVHHSPYNR